MGVPRVYRQSPQGVVATYDYTSFLDGVGYETFYALATLGTAGITYKLVTQTTPSITDVAATGNVRPELESTSGSKSNTASALALTKTFSSDLFNKPRIVEGTFNALIGMIISSANAPTCSFIITVYKNDGSTQTQLGTATSAEFADSGGIASLFAIPVTISRAKIGIGDYLQVKVDIYAYVNTGSYEVILGHDPAARDGQTIKPSTSNLHFINTRFLVPFKIID